MRHQSTFGRFGWARSLIAGAAAASVACALAGCQADYAADITNKTPQPVMAKIFRKGDKGAVLGDARRLGPGDRALVGPVRTDKGHGAFLSVDTFGDPTRPLTLGLAPGQVFLEIQQEGEGPNALLRIVVKP
jgi:hypothetical protein